MGAGISPTALRPRIRRGGSGLALPAPGRLHGTARGPDHCRTPGAAARPGQRLGRLQSERRAAALFPGLGEAARGRPGSGRLGRLPVRRDRPRTPGALRLRDATAPEMPHRIRRAQCRGVPPRRRPLPGTVERLRRPAGQPAGIPARPLDRRCAAVGNRPGGEGVLRMERTAARDAVGTGGVSGTALRLLLPGVARAAARLLRRALGDVLRLRHRGTPGGQKLRRSETAARRRTDRPESQRLLPGAPPVRTGVRPADFPGSPSGTLSGRACRGAQDVRKIRTPACRLSRRRAAENRQPPARRRTGRFCRRRRSTAVTPVRSC